MCSLAGITLSPMPASPVSGGSSRRRAVQNALVPSTQPACALGKSMRRLRNRPQAARSSPLYGTTGESDPTAEPKLKKFLCSVNGPRFHPRAQLGCCRPRVVCPIFPCIFLLGEKNTTHGGRVERLALRHRSQGRPCVQAARSTDQLEARQAVSQALLTAASDGAYLHIYVRGLRAVKPALSYWNSFAECVANP
jgi:hypothetical protein